MGSQIMLSFDVCDQINQVPNQKGSTTQMTTTGKSTRHRLRYYTKRMVL
jgi:hypothetical protein